MAYHKMAYHAIAVKLIYFTCMTWFDHIDNKKSLIIKQTLPNGIEIPSIYSKTGLYSVKLIFNLGMSTIKSDWFRNLYNPIPVAKLEWH